MELTDEEKATLKMLGLSPEQYQEQFPNKNEAGQRVNGMGLTLDDYWTSMLADDSGYDFPPSVKGVGHGSVRPVTVTPPSGYIKESADLMQKLPQMQKDMIMDAYFDATEQINTYKFRPTMKEFEEQMKEFKKQQKEFEAFQLRHPIIGVSDTPAMKKKDD